MALLDIPLTQVTEADIARLVKNAIPEGHHHDYKEAMIGGSEKDRKDFLADVVSFANAGGGDLIIGVREQRNEKGEPTGIPDEIVDLEINFDKEKLRLGDLIRDAVDPRIPGVDMQQVGSCFVIRVPRSPIGPHMVKIGASRFYSRHTNGRYPLNVSEIRDAVLGGETRRERLRSFRVERVGRIVANETPSPSVDAPKVILHALTLFGGEEFYGRVMSIPYPRRGPALIPIGSRSTGSPHHNLDGYVVGPVYDDDVSPYTQLFKLGHLETVHRAYIAERDKRRFLPAVTLERHCIEVVDAWLELWRNYLLNGRVFLGLTVTGVRGAYMLATDDRAFSVGGAPVDRDVILMDEVEVEDFTLPSDVILRPVFDLLWQAGGWEASPFYGKDGRRAE